MITAMRDIAKLLDKDRNVPILQKVLTLHQVIDKVIVLKVKKGDTWDYQGAAIIDFDPDNAIKYLYRQGPPNGPGTTPAALITEVAKTFPKKVLGWFKRVPKWGKDKIPEEELDYILGVGDALMKKEERIVNEIDKLLHTIDRSKGNTLLTIELDHNGRHLIGESKQFMRLFVELVKERYYTKYGTTARNEGICYMCNDTKDEVYGFVTDIFSFYNLHKKGFAPVLDVSQGWKSFPVCFECAIALETSKKFLDEHLLFKFYGAKYYLIPRTILGHSDALRDILDIFREQRDDISIADDSGRLTDEENEILKSVSKLDDSVLLNFLIFIMEQASMRILGYLEDVLPSRISRIFSIKESLEKKELYSESFVSFNFSILRDIVALGRDAKDFKEFIEVTGRIFKGQKVNRRFLLSRVLTYLEKQRNEHGLDRLVGRSSASEKRKMNDSVLRSMMLLEFVHISNNGGDTEKMKGQTQELEREQIVEAILKEHPSFFETHSQKAAFLIGLLTGRLLAIQAYERGAAPFEKKLHNLRFTMKRLQRLYVQVEMKLKAYGHSGSYQGLEHMLAEEIMSAATEDVDDDELSLSFVIGLNQSYKIKSTKGDDEE